MTDLSSEEFPSIGEFRVLVVDDEAPIREEILAQLEPTGVVPLVAATADHAYEILEERYVDAAIVDIKLGDSDAGREVLRFMGRFAPAATAVIATQYTDRLGDFIGIRKPLLTEIIHKGPEMAADWARRPLEQALREWRARHVTINNLGLVVKLLEERGSRIDRLRAESELAIEVDRLFRRLFGSVTVEDGAHHGGVTIDLTPIEREGLSAAITVEGIVRLGRDHAARELRGSRVVLKIGRSDDIDAEADRYHTFVKYGVPLTHRVELLGHAADQALGAVSYSFAGNVFGTSLESLDEQLRSPERQQLVNIVMYSLFDEPAKSWYRVTAEPVAAIQYVTKTYKTKFPVCHQMVDSMLKALNRSFGNEVTSTFPTERADGQLAVGQAALRLPRHSIWGSGLFLKRIETCLVHGDMHGGNVMIELEGDGLKRVCLIDYGSAGPGPRATDFAALDATCRLADLQRILAEFDAEDENELGDDDFRRAVMMCAGRVRDERKILAAAWDPGGLRWSPSDPWAATSIQLASLARTNFDTLPIDEMIAMAMPAAYRHLGYRIGVLGHVRFAAWLSALYERYQQLYPPTTDTTAVRSR